MFRISDENISKIYSNISKWAIPIFNVMQNSKDNKV
jgi:hypothetical protein